MSVIGTISGTALAVGTSHNARHYTRGMIAAAHAEARDRLADPAGLPLPMFAGHANAAADDGAKITGHVRTVQLEDDGSLSFTADIVNTAAGRDVLAAMEAGSLRAVSIRGAFTGKVRTEVRGGQQVTTADGLSLAGLDHTSSPGVDRARITTVKRTARESVVSVGALVQESARPRSVDPARVVSEVAPAAGQPLTVADLDALPDDEARSARLDAFGQLDTAMRAERAGRAGSPFFSGVDWG